MRYGTGYKPANKKRISDGAEVCCNRQFRYYPRACRSDILHCVDCWRSNDYLMLLKKTKSARNHIDLGLLPHLLGYRLRLAQRAVFADFRHRVGDAEIGPGLFGMLEIVQANPGIKQSDLAHALGLDRSSLVPALNRLEARKLLSRVASSDDRRSNGLHLSDSGIQLLRDMRRRVRRHETRLAKRLTTEEHELLMFLLAKVTQEPI
jgi:DNA-binding MarR family transcriptional regulator